MHTIGAYMIIGARIEQDDCATPNFAGARLGDYSE